MHIYHRGLLYRAAITARHGMQAIPYAWDGPFVGHL